MNDLEKSVRSAEAIRLQEAESLLRRLVISVGNGLKLSPAHPLVEEAREFLDRDDSAN